MRPISVSAAWASVVGAVLIAASPAWAIVDTIDATARAEVQEFVAPDIVNTDSAFESLDESTSNLPLVTEAALRQVDAEQNLLGSGKVSSVFNDPRLIEDENPSEFGLDMAVYSLSSDVTYTGAGKATETREITFTADDLPGVADGTPLIARSQFFLNGFMMVWGEPDASAGATFANVRVRVFQQRAGNADETTVLDTTLHLTRDEQGVPVVTTDGPLTSDNIAVVDTEGLISELGFASFLVIPEIGIPYTYEVNLGERFTLRAVVDCDIANAPLAGAGMTLGLTEEAFLGLIEELTGVPAADLLDILTADNVAAAKPLPYAKGIDLIPNSPLASALSLSNLCGLLGAETLLPLACLPLALMASSRRKRA